MTPLTLDKVRDAELVRIVLGKSLVDNACLQLAHLYVHAPGSELSGIAQEHGITPLQHTKLEAAVELGRRVLAARQVELAKTVTTPEDVVALMEPIFAGLQREHFYVLCLSTKNKLKRMSEVSIGSLNSSIVHPRELFREAILVSAASVIIVHNHPSGDPQPSSADIQLTRRLARAGEVLGIEILDHVVLGGEGRFASLRNNGVL